MAIELILKPPDNVEYMVEPYSRRAGKGDEEDEYEGVYHAQDNRAPYAVDKDVGERCGHPAVEAKDGYLDESAADDVVELNGHSYLQSWSVLSHRRELLTHTSLAVTKVIFV